MAIRIHRTHTVAHAFAFSLAIAALAPPTPGQSFTRESIANRAPLPWLGCWDALVDPEDVSREPPIERQTICVVPGSAPNVLKMTISSDDKIVSEEIVIADGSRRPVSDGGCDGWIRSVLSEDRRRLYLESEATCEDGNPRRLSGASMIVAGDRWIDIHALWVDGARELLIQRYRPVEAGIPRLPGALPSSSHAARLEAATPLNVDDVLEALQIVDPAVIEAMLVESDARFGIDSDLLLRLDAAGVPGELIDLMVALSFPEYFEVEEDAVGRQPEVYYGGYWSPWFPYYGYGHYYYHRYAHRDGNQGGKAVSGRGYVRVQPAHGASGGLGSFPRRGAINSRQFTGGGRNPGVGAGSSSASGSGYTSEGSKPTRPAIPKPR